MPGLENIAELWQQAADADMPERICLRYISGCRRRQKRSFHPRQKEVAMVATYPADGASIRIYRTLA